MEQWILLIIGIVIALMGITGAVNKTRKGSRLANRIGDMPARLLYIVIGMGLIIWGFLR